MLNKNIKQLRKNRGWSQEELAQSLYTSRQTISKWENGISVPDANSLITLAETFSVSVSELLGDNITEEINTEKIAEKLEVLNTILAQKENRSRNIWKTIGRVFLYVFIAFIILLIVITLIFGGLKFNEIEEEVYSTLFETVRNYIL